MDPITTGIVIVLGKYALDKGAELGKEVGPKALDTAKEMFDSVLGYFRQMKDKTYVASALENNPENAQPLVESELDQAVKADPDFKAQLEALLTRYDEEAAAHARTAGTSYTAVFKGSGAQAQGAGATAVGERGVNVAGNVGGNIITGDGHVIHVSSPSGSPASIPTHLAPLRDQIVRVFNRSELQSLCFDLGIACDDLPGETRTELAQSLIAYCYGRDRLPDLLAFCQTQRPRANWTF